MSAKEDDTGGLTPVKEDNAGRHQIDPTDCVVLVSV